MYVDYFPSMFFFFKQKTAYEMRISDWSSDVCSSDLFSGSEDADDAAHGGSAVCWRESGAAGRTGNVGSGMRAHQSVADAEPGAEAIVELLGLGPADYRPGQHPGQGALVGLDGFGEGAETGSAQLIAFGDGLGGIAE